MVALFTPWRTSYKKVLPFMLKNVKLIGLLNLSTILLSVGICLPTLSKSSFSQKSLLLIGNPDSIIGQNTPPSYPLYCHGPLITSIVPKKPFTLTPFKWSSQGAGSVIPGPGECAWADRGPRGSEINSSNGNIIRTYRDAFPNLSGNLNTLPNLPAGKYWELGVYRDPNLPVLIVTQVVGFVKPPFSTQPILPNCDRFTKLCSIIN